MSDLVHACITLIQGHSKFKVVVAKNYCLGCAKIVMISDKILIIYSTSSSSDGISDALSPGQKVRFFSEPFCPPLTKVA